MPRGVSKCPREDEGPFKGSGVVLSDSERVWEIRVSSGLCAVSNWGSQWYLWGWGRIGAGRKERLASNGHLGMDGTVWGEMLLKWSSPAGTHKLRLL